MKTGRPRLDNPNTITLSFKINLEQLQQLKAYCTLTKQAQGEVIRAALDEYIKSKIPDEKPKKPQK